MVMWIHSALTTRASLTGGFFGVDVFFVLSGMLITTLLVAEHERLGRISLRDFYVRRALRLLPALGVCLVLGAVVRAVAGPYGHGLGWEALGAVLYVQNWVSALDVDRVSYLNHLWSLSIEEQFYLCWPPLLLLLLRRGLAVRRIAAGTAAVAVLVLLVRWGVHHHYPARSGSGYRRYYLNSFARLDEILIGVTVGLRGPATWRRLAPWAPAGALGIAVLAWRGDVADGWVYEWGLTAVALCAVVVVAACATGSGWVAALLSARPLVAVGTVSYGLYLYHFPLVLALRATSWSDPVRVVLGLLLPVPLAILSWVLVESPALRRKHRFEPVG